MSLEVALSAPDRGVDLHLNVPTGQTLALLGPNGAGKSTVIETVAGLLRPASGRVVVADRVLTSVAADDAPRFVRPHHRNVAVLSQDPLLFPHLSVADNVAFGPRSRGDDRRTSRRIAQEWLDRLQVGDLGTRHPDQLSGGQAQRVAVARALATEPDVVLLDEPMAALDAQIAPAVRRTLQDLLAPRTALLVTHDLVDALALADQVAVLDGGRVVEAGPTLHVLTQPRSAFAAHLADLNLATGHWRGDHLELSDGRRLEGQLTDAGLESGAPAAAVFRPGAVSIFAETPHGSPRNHLDVTVIEIRPHAGTVRVVAGAYAADITPTAQADLALTPGDRVVFSVKATEVTVYGTRAEP